MQRNYITRAIIKTLCYAQIFSYPLTVSEVWKYMISEKSISRSNFVLHLHNNKHLFEQFQQYVVLPGDKKLIEVRTKRAYESRRKLAKALWVSQILSFIPTIQLIGISGSLSMYNSKPYDDIDLFFVTKKNSLWTTRFLVNILLLVLGEKRKRKETFAEDKICPNMFMSEDALSLKDKNLYSAHELSQLKILMEKNNMHQRLLHKNAWVLKFMPHAFTLAPLPKNKTHGSIIFSLPLSLVEYVFFHAQYYYMKNKITNEKIKKNMASFHPLKHKDVILELYDLKVKTQQRIIKNAPTVPKKAAFHAVN